MGAKRRNGVEAAIALLEALADAGPARPGALALQLGLSRASLHRIASDLAGEGLVTQSRGRLALGPVVAGFLAGHAARLSAEPPMEGRVAPAAAPLRLTAPPPLQRRRQLRIGFSNAGMDNLWRVALVHSVEHAAAELAAEIDWFAVRQAEGDAERQGADIADLLAAGVHGLLVSAVDAVASAPAVAAAMMRVPVVMVDRPVAAEVIVSAVVTGDDHALGTTTALWLAETLKGTGRILMLAGRQDAEPARRRLAAAKAVFGGFAGMEVLETAWTDWRRDRAFDRVAAALHRWRGDIAGVWCDSGLQGAGSLQAFLAAGYRPGEIPPHTGGDLNLAYKLALRQRVRLAGVDYPPQMGARAMGLLHDLLRGRWVPKEVTVASGVTITRGHATRSVRPDQWADKHVRWDLPDDLVLGAGLGAAYDPRRFRIHYPGNRYNRSAARP